MSRIIIENKSLVLEDQDALRLVMKVIQGGRVSNDNKQYCYATSFHYGITGETHHVVTSLNKKSDTFTVYDKK
jgi:hypothetical protein